LWQFLIGVHGQNAVIWTYRRRVDQNRVGMAFNLVIFLSLLLVEKLFGYLGRLKYLLNQVRFILLLSLLRQDSHGTKPTLLRRLRMKKIWGRIA
jgi:hypothetical protein